MKSIRFVTPGGIPGTNNIYFTDWTYLINSRANVSSYDKTTFTVVETAYEEEHPEEEEKLV